MARRGRAGRRRRRNQHHHHNRRRRHHHHRTGVVHIGGGTSMATRPGASREAIGCIPQQGNLRCMLLVGIFLVIGSVIGQVAVTIGGPSGSMSMVMRVGGVALILIGFIMISVAIRTSRMQAARAHMADVEMATATNVAVVQGTTPSGFEPPNYTAVAGQTDYPYPQTQYPQAQYPQAQYPQAQYPQAQYPQAQYPGAPVAQYPSAPGVQGPQYPPAPGVQGPQYPPGQGSQYPARPQNPDGQPPSYPSTGPSAAEAPPPSYEEATKGLPEQ